MSERTTDTAEKLADAAAEATRADADAVAPDWSRTLWVMVAIQFVMTMAFSMLSPIMPLFLPELGVTTPGGVDLWAGILGGSTSFVAAFVSPLWGRIADRIGIHDAFALACVVEAAGVLASVLWQSLIGVMAAALLVGGTFTVPSVVAAGALVIAAVLAK